MNLGIEWDNLEEMEASVFSVMVGCTPLESDIDELHWQNNHNGTLNYEVDIDITKRALRNLAEIGFVCPDEDNPKFIVLTRLGKKEGVRMMLDCIEAFSGYYPDELEGEDLEIHNEVIEERRVRGQRIDYGIY